MKKLCLLSLLLLSKSLYALNITGAWASDGGDKIAQEVLYPHGATSSTTTISRTWDGRTITPFSAQNQTVGFEIVVIDKSGADATNVTVSMSSMSCANSTGITSVVVSSLNVTDTSARPIQVFSAWYLMSQSLSVLPYGRNEYEERQYPLDYRVPCTVNVNNDCIPNGGTDLWVNRLYANKHIPIAWIPEEEFLVSSETIANGTSKSYWVDVYISTNIPAGQCTGVFTVNEGVSISTQLPVNLKVYGVQLPAKQVMPVIGYVGNADTTGRLQGNRSASTPLTGAFLTGVNNIAKILKAHNIMPEGDLGDSSLNDFPSQDYIKHLNGSLYTSANGYGNSRGVGVPDSFYMVDMYNANYSNNQTTFCNFVSSWSANLSSYSGLKVGLYGQDEAPNQAQNELWAALLSTSCTLSGAPINMFVTGDINVIQSTAPHAWNPASTNVYGNGISSSSATWQTNFNKYNTGSSSAVWRYNEGTEYQGAMFPYEEEGYVPEANFWAYWKKLCPNGICRGGWMAWETNYWRDVNNGGQPNNNDNNLYQVDKTFGYDSGSNSQFGRSGFDRSGGDGVLVFPGTDVVFSSPSFGVNGGFAAFNLKNLRKGIDDADYLSLAYAVNASSTMAIVQQMFPTALWEGTCFAPATDCTYSYGDRSWQYSSDMWVRARERLLQIVQSGPPAVSPGQTTQKWSGPMIFYRNSAFR